MVSCLTMELAPLKTSSLAQALPLAWGRHYVSRQILVYSPSSGVDLASFLAVYGSIFDGNLLSYSIGGLSASVSTSGLTGKPYSLSGSYIKHEADVSPIRGDLYHQ